MRKYGFRADEIPVEQAGNLSLALDPKEAWARQHPEFFPVNLNKDDAYRLLRVPGLGQVAVRRILVLRKQGLKMRSLGNLIRQQALFEKACAYVEF